MKHDREGGTDFSARKIGFDGLVAWRPWGEMWMRLRPLVVIFFPLLTLALLAWWLGGQPASHPQALAESEADRGGWSALDFSKAAAVDEIPGWDIRRGSFRLTRENGKTALEQLPEPMVEGKVIGTRAMRGAAGVRARMQGERSRRAFPRFSIGLHQEREWHLRALPGERKLELTTCNADLSDEALLATLPLPTWEWRPEHRVWLELQILPESGGRFRCEGRLWTEGEHRPEKPSLQHRLELPHAVFFAALQGAPYALRPIVIDAAETLPAQSNAPSDTPGGTVDN